MNFPESVGVLQAREHIFAREAGKTLQNLFDAVSGAQVRQYRLHGHTRSLDDRATVADVGMAFNSLHGSIVAEERAFFNHGVCGEHGNALGLFFEPCLRQANYE